MASKRNSFLLYIDSLDVLDDLSDEQAGKLFKAIKAHQKGVELDVDPLINIAMSPFKAQFARDAEKYEKICNRNKNNGLKGGRPKNPEEPKEPSGLFGNPSKPKKADSDSDSDSDTKEDKDISASPKREALDYQQIVDIYHEVLPSCPGIAQLTDYRKTKIRNFWSKFKFDMEKWRAYLNFISVNCTWMTESRPNGKGGMWKCKNLEYFVTEKCYLSVKEDRACDQ